MQEHYIELPSETQTELTRKTEDDIPDACPFFQNLRSYPLPELELEVASRTIISFQPRAIVQCVQAKPNNPVCNDCVLRPGKLVTLDANSN